MTLQPDFPPSGNVIPMCVEPPEFGGGLPDDDGKWPWALSAAFILLAAGALWALIGFAVVGFHRGWW